MDPHGTVIDVIVTCSSAVPLTDDGEAAGHGERGHVQDCGAGETADATEQGP